MKILFMCVANSARSQMAEGVAKKILGESFDVRSAGSQPSKVNPLAIRALREEEINVSELCSKSVVDLPDEFVNSIDYVITLCSEEVCPRIISNAKKLHWPLPDPVNENEDEEGQMLNFRNTRDEITKRITQLAIEIYKEKI